MRKHLFLAALVAALILPGVALGQNITYDDVANGSFGAVATWTYTGIPTGTAYPSQPGDTALIDSNTVTLDVSVPAGVSTTLATGTIAIPQAWISPTISGSLAVTAPSAFFANGGDYADVARVVINGPITGTGLLTMSNRGRGVRIDSAANSFSGGWLIKGGDDYYWGTTVNADMALGTGPINVTGGSLRFLTAQSYGSGTNPAQPTLGLNSGSLGLAVSDDLDVTLNGGAIFIYNTTTQSGDFNVTANSRFTDGTDHTDWWVRINGAISGAGKLSMLNSEREARINNANAGFSGGWEVGQIGVTSGLLRAEVDGALGTGSIVVNAGYLAYAAAQTATVVATVNGGNVRLNLPAATPLNANLTMAGGAVTTSGAGAAQELAGLVTLTGNAGLNTGNAQAMTVSAQVTGSYKVTKGAGSQAVTLTNGTNSYTGGTDVTLGLLNVNAVHALGTGTATAKGGTLQSNINDAFASVPTVIAAENGTVILNANENSASILIQAGGAFDTLAGFVGDTLDYTGVPNPAATNVLVEKGAILASDLPKYPTLVQLVTGSSSANGVFVAAAAGTYTVGGAGNIFIGLGASANTTFSGTVNEAAGGTEGIGMLATTPATFTYTNATFNTVGGNTVKLYGAGTHVIGAGNAFNSNIDMEGTTGGLGRVQITTAGGISGHTLNVNSGRLEVTNAAALDSAVANINAGGIFRVLAQSLTTGTIHTTSGGVVTWDGDSTRFNSGAAWDFQTGSGLLLTALTGPFQYPLGTTPVNLFMRGITGSDDYTRFDNVDVPLSDDTRVTMAAIDATHGYDCLQAIYTLANKWYVVPGSSSGRFTAATGAFMAFGGSVDLTGKTLIIGDVNSFSTPIADGAGGFAMLGQAGTVRLANHLGYYNFPDYTNVIGIGKIDVQAGTFEMELHNMLVGTTEINVNTGATMSFLQGAGLTLTNTLVKGNGTVQMAGGQTLTLNATGAGAGVISPGTSAGILNLTGDLTVSNDGAGNYGRVAIEVAGSGNVAGVDYDALAVSGTANVTAGQMLVSLAAPSGTLRPTTPDWGTPGTPSTFITRNLGDMTVLTAGVAVTGTFASEVLDANPKLAGVQATGPWQVKSGAVLADYASGNSVVLKGADIVWMALPGDANLDRAADVSDLSLLAGNFRKTVNQTWLQGDFNFDGRVDVSDLSLLAGRFRQTNPFPPAEGGAPVPEPMTMVLLGLGGLAVLARRRNK